MRRRFLFVLLVFLSVSVLTSCKKASDYQDILDDYVFSMKYHDNFNILQLTDIHWNANTSTMASERYLEKVFTEADKHIKETQGEDAKIDLVELTGDMFMLANTYHIKTFIKFFEEKATEFGFYYAVLWGNHDRHGLYNPNYLAKKFANAPHCFYFEGEDNLYGRSNFVINLTADGKKESNAIWQIVNLDSGASFSETSTSPFKDYDYIREDQIDWWLKVHEKAGTNVPTIAYYHIPQDENLVAWNLVTEEGQALKNKFFKLEGFADNGNEKYASDFYEIGAENNLKAAFMGHAHNVDWTVEYLGVVLGLGVKTGPELYYAHIDVNSTDENMIKGLASVGITENFDLIGASLVTILDSNNFALSHLYLNERESDDFVAWVNW